MKVFTLTLATIAVLVVGPTPRESAEQCTVEPAYTFYVVEGDSAEQIEASLRERGPRDERGKTRFASTDWTIEWKWSQLDSGQVDLSSLSLTCGATIQLPRLRVSRNASLETIREWNDFLERTHRHELAHVEHVRTGAGRIRDRLLRVQSKVGPLTPTSASKVVSAAIQELHELDIAYDARTNHGNVEGTWKIKPSAL